MGSAARGSVAAVALTTIALGVAGPTITFTMIKAWILEPLPFADPDALVDIRTIDRASGDTASLNAADFRDLHRGANAFSDLAGYRLADVRLTGGDRAERLRGALVTTGFFDVLGTTAALGRVFEPASPCSPPSSQRGEQRGLIRCGRSGTTEVFRLPKLPKLPRLPKFWGEFRTTAA